MENGRSNALSGDGVEVDAPLEVGGEVFGDVRRQDRAMTLSLPIDPEATKLLYDSPLALILAMLLDQ
jgi:hypothetical protein